MSFFKTLRSAELDTSAESTGEIREFVRRDIAGLSNLPRPPERDGETLAGRLGALPRPPERDSEVVATKLGSLLQRVIGASVQNIDDVILELQDFRERLDNESARMQREIVEYATMSSGRDAVDQDHRREPDELEKASRQRDAEHQRIGAEPGRATAAAPCCQGGMTFSSNRHPALAFLLERDLFRKPVSTHSASEDARERAYDQVRGRLFRDHAPAGRCPVDPGPTDR